MNHTQEHKKGSINELKAALWFIENDYPVYFPMIQGSAVDFVADYNGLKRVQVKTATWNRANPHKYLQVRTRRGNGSKHAHCADDFDLLVIMYEDGMWIIPAEAVDTSNLSLLHNRKRGEPNRWEPYRIY